MKLLYFSLMLISFTIGYLGGFAGYSWTKWFAMPAFAFGFGAWIKFMWAF